MLLSLIIALYHRIEIQSIYLKTFILDDIMVQFFTPDKKRELMWVREQSRQGNSVIGRLIDEPFNPLVGLHNGDSVEVVPHEFDDGEVIPVALLPWMKQR